MEAEQEGKRTRQNKQTQEEVHADIGERIGGRSKQPIETVERVLSLGKEEDITLHLIIEVLSHESYVDSTGQEFDANDKTVPGKLDVLRRILWSENLIVGTDRVLSQSQEWEVTVSAVLEYAKVLTSVSQIASKLNEAGIKCSDGRVFPLDTLWHKEIEAILGSNSVTLSKKRPREEEKKDDSKKRKPDGEQVGEEKKGDGSKKKFGEKKDGNGDGPKKAGEKNGGDDGSKKAGEKKDGGDGSKRKGGKELQSHGDVNTDSEKIKMEIEKHTILTGHLLQIGQLYGINSIPEIFGKHAMLSLYHLNGLINDKAWETANIEFASKVYD